jgi:ring-1,2-phenylacetyl-CoA epoxidase subunit PaaC
MASPTSEAASLPDVWTVADGCLLASHRLSEWVSNSPTMEEDVAIGNIALDLLGQARGLLSHLGDEDQLAYFREADEFHNPVICELPNGDFGHTMLRSLFVDSWLALVWRAFVASDDHTVSGVAEKAISENAYHRRHSSSWVVRLGDGTDESHRRMQQGLAELWPYAGELAVDGWYESVSDVLRTATLPEPDRPERVSVPHTTHRVELLNEMQSLARAHPGASW